MTDPEVEAYRTVETLLLRTRQQAFANGITRRVWIPGLLARAAIDAYKPQFASDAETRATLHHILDSCCDGAEASRTREPGPDGPGRGTPSG